MAVELDRLMTVADYEAHLDSLLPDEPTPELMNGGLVMAARASIRHARYLRDILEAINAWIREQAVPGEVFPEVEVVLDHFTVLVPDLAFVALTNTQAVIEDECIVGPPDWVCEISSPRTRRFDAREKYPAYLRAGVREYWIADPARPAGERFACFERVLTGSVGAMPLYQPIAGGPAQSRIFPGIALPAKLL